MPTERQTTNIPLISNLLVDPELGDELMVPQPPISAPEASAPNPGQTGDMTGAELLYYRVIEQTMHGWDIARSVGGETNIDEALCEYILSGHDTIERLRGQRLFGPTTISNDDSAFSRLLSLTGRT